MHIENFSSIESQLLSLFNQNNNTFESLLNVVQFGEKTLNEALSALISKNILKFNKTDNTYEYVEKFNHDEMIVLDGNILLPTTILRIPEKNCLYVSRGAWYQFPIDFDVRRIIWNVKLDTKTNSTLVDLIKTSVMKEKKSKITQLPEYETLQNKIVPYSSGIGLLLHTIGEDITDVSILFKIKLTPTSDVSLEHRGFSIRSEISTNELLDVLKTPLSERDYTKIVLNKIYNFSDFIFPKNEIPISINSKELKYIKITGVRKIFEFTYYSMNVNSGEIQKLNIETFDDLNEAIDNLREIFKGYPSVILSENNFCIELTD